jgi:acyl carrier protein phosphodiesterase
MNYLAHAFLARQSPELLTGGLLGDFVKGAVDEHYNPAVRSGILLHRAIDRYTDAHAVVAASRALISTPRRRFAGILVDVFYDHFLARHWHRYGDEPLEQFTAQVYATLWPQRSAFPERLQRILPFMRADDWLASYAEIESVEMALKGIARRFQRFPRAVAMAGSIEELSQNYTALEECFLEFFPQLQAFVQDEIAPLGGPALCARQATG